MAQAVSALHIGGSLVPRQADDADVGLACCFYSRDIGRGALPRLCDGIEHYIEIKYMCMDGL